MYLVRNLIIFCWWIVATWLALNQQAVWMAYVLTLLFAALGYRLIVPDYAPEIAPMAGVSRYSLLTSLTALTVVKGANYSGTVPNLDINKIMTQQEEKT